MTALVSRPGTLSIGLARGAFELRQFFRQKETVVFTFSLPVLLMVLLGSVFGDVYPDTGLEASQLFAAGMIGAGIISTSFVSMGIGVALDRENGTLKRLRGTPMPATSYFIGKIVLVAVSSLAQAAIMLTIASLMFGLTVPTSPEKWLTFAWVFALGVTGCAALGVAASSLARSVNGAAAGTNIVFLALQFASGVLVTPITALPDVMVNVSSFFPVKWMCQGLRSVFLPEEAARYEMAGQWELGLTALVLSAWCVAGLLLCRLVFRWTNNRE
ncbi:ABC transporter permease [Prauserella cavernicola]|uniref:Transport permease protein n=1 Tax=Prauserella cavernicola TaxID=2800127 RepID=A0A934QTL9_9PSEU|nr:ABC transporter permease [Prauserella cavernicola]MBK1785419.1 ABC transporter permease [Prauserella cavernicola]